MTNPKATARLFHTTARKTKFGFSEVEILSIVLIFMAFRHHGEFGRYMGDMDFHISLSFFVVVALEECNCFFIQYLVVFEDKAKGELIFLYSI